MCRWLLLLGAMLPLTQVQAIVQADTVGGMADSATSAAMAASVAAEPSSAFVPGLYFSKKAAFYLHNRDYASAIHNFRLAAFWGNKIAQYNLGVIYFNGMGVPADRPTGVAWLAVAAEQHGSLADMTLLEAYARLDADEKRSASKITAELLDKYGDAVAIVRAKQRYVQAKRQITGSHLGFVGNLRVYTGSHNYEEALASAPSDTGESFHRDQAESFDQFLRNVTGRVEVGEVATLPMPPPAPVDKQ